jgi:hypothetical protein
MRYAGSFHVSFNPIGGGESRGTIYFRENNAPAGGDRDGVVSFNGKNVTDDQLFGLLKESQSNDKDLFVLIKADETTPLKKLTFVMDSCRKTGLNKFSLQSR